MLTIKNLRKSYGGRYAVIDKLDLEIPNENQIICLLGPNGTGKTTLLKSICGWLRYNTGQITINDQLVKNGEIMDDVFFSPDIVPFFSYNANKLFKIMADLHSTWDQELATQLCDKLALDRKKNIAKLSFGYRRILSNIIGLAVSKPITIFDEPINGLDPVMRDQLFQMLNYVKENKPRTIVISTHLADEVAKVSDRVLIMQKGKIVVDKTLEEINDSAYILVGPSEKVMNYVTGKVMMKEEMGPYVKVAVFGTRPVVEDDAISVQNMSLQEFFVKYIQGGSIDV